jgi:hypothetical protein
MDVRASRRSKKYDWAPRIAASAFAKSGSGSQFTEGPNRLPSALSQRATCACPTNCRRRTGRSLQMR